MIPSCLFCDPVASSCCIVSVRKPTGTQVIAEEVTTSPKKSDNRWLWVEQSIEVLGKSTPDSDGVFNELMQDGYSITLESTCSLNVFLERR